jgi:hypothetical protein
MLFRIKKSYKSLLTAQEVESFIKYLESKETGISFLKSKVYNIEHGHNKFTVRKRGGTSNGPIYPPIKLNIIQREFVQIDLDIEPSYFVILFFSVVCSVLSLSVLLNNKITINGEYREPDLIERFLWFLFPIALANVLCYFKTIKPTRDAEAWLIKKLKLTRLP